MVFELKDAEDFPMTRKSRQNAGVMMKNHAQRFERLDGLSGKRSLKNRNVPGPKQKDGKQSGHEGKQIISRKAGELFGRQVRPTPDQNRIPASPQHWRRSETNGNELLRWRRRERR
jgi:hypothetical protein